MATLVPGILLKLVQHMNTEVKVAGEHRSSLLQVVSIVPALAGGDLFQNQGFYLKVSDSAHATYVALPDEHNDLILSDKIQLGQYIHAERLESASPVPILRGVRLVPGRHPCIGTPEDIVAANSPGFLNRLSKAKYPPSKLSVRAKGEQSDRKGLSITRSKSIGSKPGGSLLERKPAFGRSYSIPSSPRNSYSLPTSFEKFSAGVKNQAKIKSDRGTPPTTLGRDVNGTPKKQPLVSSPGRFARLIEMGPKGLTRSWEGNMDNKRRYSLDSKSSKQDMISSGRLSVPKRADDRLSIKGENKTQTSSKSSTRHSTGHGTSDNLDKSSKQRSSVGRRSSDTPSNGLPGNSVKAVCSSNMKLIDATVLWTSSLPPSLNKLGKEVLNRRNSAQMAAIDALQQASAAESILRCLSKYSELTSSAKEDNPKPAVEQFLALHSSLKNALLVTNSLSKTPSATSSPDNTNISSEKHKQASSWINAAISTDLLPFSVYSDRPTTLAPFPASSPLKTLPKSRLSVSSKTRAPPLEWTRGNGVEEYLELAENVQEESEKWFLGFVEGFLDSDVDTSSALSDNGQKAGMLTQLKRVNDWLDEISGRATKEDEEDDEEESVRVSSETIERLRKKIYEYLLTHFESAAAAALGSGSHVVMPIRTMDTRGRR